MSLTLAQRARIEALDPVRQELLRDELARREAARRLASAYPKPYDLAITLDPYAVQTPALSLIDDALVDVDAGQCTRLIITMPPQEGKSTRVARVGSLWALRRNPNRRVAIVSYADNLAAEHGGWVRDQIVGFGLDAPRDGGEDLLGLRVRRTSSALSRWNLAGDRGSLRTAGIGGGITGKPVDWFVIDDPFANREQADSKVIRDKVWLWWTDVVLARGPRVVILIMTRWHEDDLAGRLLKEDEALPPELRQWRVVNIPAQADPRVADPDPLGRAPGEYMESARGRTPVDEAPVRDAKFWEVRKRNARTWSALYQGNPTPAEGGMFKWDWIRPYRVGAPPALARIVVAVDTTGGGSDEAGIIAAGRGFDRRTYVLADWSGPFTAGGQWRRAWLCCLEVEADVLVYERNLVDPIMRKAINASWRRMLEQAEALEAAGVLELDLDDADPDVLTERVAVAAHNLRGAGDDDVLTAADPLAALTGQLLEVLPYAARILTAPEKGPCRVDGVSATRGKTVRADAPSQAYETGGVSHVGVFPDLEAELTTWQEGQASPNRLDADVWAWTFLNSRSGPATTSVPTGAVPMGPAAALGGGNR